MEATNARELSLDRRRILATLGESQWTATELAFALRRLRTNIARDLRLMRDLGLVESRRDGVCVFWRVIQQSGRADPTAKRAAHQARHAPGETP